MGRQVKYLLDFIKYTAEDFVHVWEDRPNVLIWCATAGILLYWI